MTSHPPPSPLVPPQRLSQSGQWRRSYRPESRWRRRGLRVGGGEAACGGFAAFIRAPSCCAAGPAGRWAPSLAGWPAGPAPPRPSPPPWRPRAAGSSGRGAPSCRAGERGPGPARPVQACSPPAGEGVPGPQPVSPAAGREAGAAPLPGKGLSGAPPWLRGWGHRGSALLQGREVSGVSALAAGWGAAVGGMPGALQTVGQGDCAGGSTPV